MESVRLIRWGRYVNSSNFIFKIYIRRNYVFYVVILLVPLKILTIVSLVAFMLPPQVGAQKVVVPISVIISLNVFILLIESILPKTLSIPYIGNLMKQYPQHELKTNLLLFQHTQ